MKNENGSAHSKIVECWWRRHRKPKRTTLQQYFWWSFLDDIFREFFFFFWKTERKTFYYVSRFYASRDGFRFSSLDRYWKRIKRKSILSDSKTSQWSLSIRASVSERRFLFIIIIYFNVKNEWKINLHDSFGKHSFAKKWWKWKKEDKSTSEHWVIYTKRRVSYGE